MKAIKLQLPGFLCFLLCFGQLVQACPVFVPTSSLPDKMTKDYQSLRFYSFQVNRAEPWVAHPLQVDFFDENERLLLPKAGEKVALDPAALGNYDRISLQVNDFGTRRELMSPLPCQGKIAVELVRRDVGAEEKSRFAYLVLCEKDKAPIVGETRVQYLEQTSLLRSPVFEYFFDHDNHMLFKKIFLNQAGVFVPVAKNSDLLIKSDIKYFFTLLFRPSDVNSTLETYRTGPLSVVGALSFYLKILFFKIRLSLTTDVSFFENAVYVPMTVYLPEGSSDRLQSGSGIVYSWQNLLGDPIKIDMPQIDLGEIPNENDVEARYCRNGDCVFSLVFKSKEDYLKMYFKLKPEQVRQKFFPSWVKHVDRKSFDKFGLGKQDDDYYQQRVAAYFETADLRDGEHGWDFWLSLVKDPEMQCPIPVSIRRIATAGIAR